MSLSQNIVYDDGGNFTYDNTKIEVTPSGARLKSLKQEVSWTSIANVTPTGSALEKTSGSGGAWDAGAFSTQQIGAGGGYIEFKAAFTNKALMCGLSPDNPSSSYTDIDFAFYLLSNGALQIYESGTPRGSFGTYVASDVFRIEVSGSTVLYKKNGVTVYTSGVSPIFPLFADTSFLDLGGKLDYVRICNNPTEFVTNSPKIVVNGGILMDGLDDLVETVDVSGSDEIKYHLLIAGVAKYYNGSAWVNSDSSHAQSNSIAEILANKATIPVSSGALVKFGATLKSNDGTTTPTLLELEVKYNFFVASPTAPPECIAYGWMKDLLGESVTSATLKIKPKKPFINSGMIILPLQKSFAANSEGYIEASLVETETKNQEVEVSIEYTESGSSEKKIARFNPIKIPNVSTKALSELLVAATS